MSQSKSKSKKDHQHNHVHSDASKKVTFPRPNNIILDVYGVTSSWNFIKEQLLPFIHNNLGQYIENHWNDRKLKRIIERLRLQSAIDSVAGFKIPVIDNENASEEQSNEIKKQIVTNILWQFDNRHKSSNHVLNIIYNMIWSEAYENGTLKTHVFDDVPSAFHRWRMEQFIKLYSYASGASDGQRLFFKSTIKGDLTKYFNNYIDSSGEKKKETKLFGTVCRSLRDIPENIVFFTDNPKEADAAIDAHVKTVIVLREGNPQLTNEELKKYICIKSFDDIEFEDDPSNPAPCC